MLLIQRHGAFLFQYPNTVAERDDEVSGSMRKNLLQGRHHEVALMHQRMRNLQVGLINMYVIVEQDVDVDDAVTVIAVDRFPRTTQLLLNGLGYPQHLTRLERCLTADAGIEKHIGRREAPRLGLDERRLPQHRADAVAKQLNRIVNEPLAVADVGSDAEINGMFHLQSARQLVNHEQAIAEATKLIAMLHSQTVALHHILVSAKGRGRHEQR